MTFENMASVIVMTITPEMAKKWLESNSNNRPVSKKHVAGIVRSIKSGLWRYTGDPIRFSITGRLLDGQHRLHACMQSGIPIECLVIRGLPDEVFTHLDTNQILRRAGDVLTTQEIPHGNVVAAIAKMYWAYENERNTLSGSTLRNDEILDLVEADREYISAASLGLKLKATRIVSASILGTLIYISRKIDRELSNDFWVGFKEDAPSRYPQIIKYRKRLTDAALAGSNLSSATKFVYGASAWNAARKNRQIIAFKHFANAKVTRLI